MNRYFVVSDVHSYYSILKETLDKGGFDINNSKHILILCGDAFDRGRETIELYKFLTSIPKERFIYIRGNHEDLLIDALEELKEYGDIRYHHYSNGTVQTIADFLTISTFDIPFNKKEVLENIQPLVDFINTSIDYYEIDDKIFIHGWIPSVKLLDGSYVKNNDWRNARPYEWDKSRWLNGQKLFKEYNVKEENKTIFCGHFHASFGNYIYHNKGSGEFTEDADFEIFKEEGIIALDACTAHTNKINLYVFEF